MLISAKDDVAKMTSYSNLPVIHRYYHYPGEWYYLAPEIIEVDAEHYEYGEKQEIFALGMLFLEMLVGQKPQFNRRNRRNQIVLTKEKLEAGEHHRMVESASVYAH